MKALWNFDDIQPRVFFAVINESFPVKMRAPTRKVPLSERAKGEEEFMYAIQSTSIQE